MPCNVFKFTNVAQWSDLSNLLAARNSNNPEVEKTVYEIIEKVRTQGDDALLEFTKKFDCPNFSLDKLRIPQSELSRAARDICPEDRALINEAIENITAFHRAQVEQSWLSSRVDGTITGQAVRPVNAAGLYIPGGQGGKTPLISTLLMTAIPAIEAGVREIVIVSPPDASGSLNKYLLATAHILGVDEVYAVGSAWAIAALAYGTNTILPVDVIAGPGNIFVTTAKRLVMGRVGIDMLAGPSEILILADKNASPTLIAADMLSQAEHDPLASAVCITDCERLLENVKLELSAQCASLPRAEIATKSLCDWGALVKVNNMQEAVELANKIAPEHLELLVDDPWALFGSIQNAGAIFLGANTPEAMGDYFAGPNHVLPTMGTARFSSALSVQTFCKKISIIYATPAFAQATASQIARLARMEGLEGHARSAELRAIKLK